MAHNHPPGRNRRQGVVLLAVLAGVVLIAALAGTLRARAGATSAALARLVETHRVALAEAAVIAQVRAAWGQPTAAIRRADGTPVVVTRDGMRWEVRVSDVEGLVDLYAAPLPVLGLLPGVSVGELASGRIRMIAGLAPGDRYGSVVQTMAAMGLDAGTRARLMPLVTQRARTGEINPDLAPPELRGEALMLAEQDIAGGDLAQISARRVD
jgi:hypothetical protein